MPPPDDSGATVASDDALVIIRRRMTRRIFTTRSRRTARGAYVSGVGPCWQPTVYVVDHSWRPYGDRGRSVYSDCGWVLAIRLFVGMGAVPLWKMVS